MLVGDWTSNRWVTMFSDEAEKLLGKSAMEVGELLENDKEAADLIFNDVSFQQKVFKLRSKVETFQVNHEELNLKLTLTSHLFQGCS